VRALQGTEAFERSVRERRKIEMLFAHLKRNLSFRRLRLRGITGAADEFLLALMSKTSKNWSGLSAIVRAICGLNTQSVNRRERTLPIVQSRLKLRRRLAAYQLRGLQSPAKASTLRSWRSGSTGQLFESGERSQDQRGRSFA
jgi:hypothetical protein